MLRFRNFFAVLTQSNGRFDPCSLRVRSPIFLAGNSVFQMLELYLLMHQLVSKFKKPFFYNWCSENVGMNPVCRGFIPSFPANRAHRKLSGRFTARFQALAALGEGSLGRALPGRPAEGNCSMLNQVVCLCFICFLGFCSCLAVCKKRSLVFPYQGLFSLWNPRGTFFQDRPGPPRSLDPRAGTCEGCVRAMDITWAYVPQQPKALEVPPGFHQNFTRFCGGASI